MLQINHAGADAAGYIRGELVVVAKVTEEEMKLLFDVHWHRREHRRTCERDMSIVIGSGAF